MDPELPAERREFMLRDCGARVVLIDGSVSTPASVGVERCVDCASIGEVVACEPGGDLHIPVDAGAAAYVMYTSGSTGTPKGVVVPHRAINRLAINNGYAEVRPDDCIAHHSNPTFDASTFEIWTALLNGARVVIVPQAVVLDAARFADALIEHGVTALYMSVGLFNQYVEALATVFGRLRYLLVGGEALEPGTIHRVLRSSPPQHLLNVYGPTECTTFATCYPIREVVDDVRSIPIGSPISNTRIYIVGLELRPQPIGVAGEILIGGPGVALGYLNRPQLSAERFLPDPFTGEAGARLYRTGDVGCWRKDGTVEYLGRNDQQVKIRGFRIEPGEIQARLLRDPRIKDAIVIAREDVPGDKRLVAYLTANDPPGAPTVEELRAQLKDSLPAYMVPSAFVALERMPLTATGKLDRRALPIPELAAYATADYEAPRGKVEERLAQMWQQLLHLPEVGRQHHFFEIGGNSLTVMRLIAMVANAFAIPFNAQAVFGSPTLAAMADVISAMQQLETRPTPASCEGELEEGVL